MKKFVYVFTKEARDKLLERGFDLMKSDDAAQTYCFINNGREMFYEDDISVIQSDVLMF